MFWVVQSDLFHENERRALLDTLERFDIPHQVIKLTANSELVPDVTATGPIITNGSILLSKIANQRGWTPGSLFNENFSYDVWYPHLKDHLLNRDAVFTTLRDADPDIDPLFTRPVSDDKSFNGRAMSLADFKIWQRAKLNGFEIRPDTPMLYAPVKVIGQEHRHYIVNGQVVSSSRYKLSGAANVSAQVDPHIVEFAERIAAIWQPARAFVLDTYVAGDEVGIVEMGSICHAGFYAADVQKIVMALDSMGNDHGH